MPMIFLFWHDGNAGAGMMTIHSSFYNQIPNGGQIVWMYIIDESCRGFMNATKDLEEPWINHETWSEWMTPLQQFNSHQDYCDNYK